MPTICVNLFFAYDTYEFLKSPSMYVCRGLREATQLGVDRVRLNTIFGMNAESLWTLHYRIRSALDAFSSPVCMRPSLSCWYMCLVARGRRVARPESPGVMSAPYGGRWWNNRVRSNYRTIISQFNLSYLYSCDSVAMITCYTCLEYKSLYL